MRPYLEEGEIRPITLIFRGLPGILLLGFLSSSFSRLPRDRGGRRHPFTSEYVTGFRAQSGPETWSSLCSKIKTIEEKCNARKFCSQYYVGTGTFDGRIRPRAVRLLQVNRIFCLSGVITSPFFGTARFRERGFSFSLHHFFLGILFTRSAQNFLTILIFWSS